MSSCSPFLNPLCVALDVDSAEKALAIAQQLKSIAGGFKIGPRLINRTGAQVIADLAKLGPVFVDCKYFDIPSTMVAAIRSAFDAGASVVTIHAMAGAEALAACAKLEAELNNVRPFKILAVTILTSWSEASYPPIIENKKSSENVVKLAKFALQNGIKSVVCSGEELTDLENLNLFKLVPGIRMDGNSKDDQKRIVTPKLAMAKGASVLVVGRPIIEANDCKEAAIKFLQNI